PHTLPSQDVFQASTVQKGSSSPKLGLQTSQEMDPNSDEAIMAILEQEEQARMQAALTQPAESKNTGNSAELDIF
ncbi:MAG: hypothetical protein SNJ56_06525, partial [Termitinemataceae bacterium]